MAWICSYCKTPIADDEQMVEVTADIKYHKQPCFGIVTEIEKRKLREIEMESDKNGSKRSV